MGSYDAIGFGLALTHACQENPHKPTSGGMGSLLIKGILDIRAMRPFIKHPSITYTVPYMYKD